MTRAALIRSGEKITSWHYALDETQWRAMIEAPPLWLIALWCDNTRVYTLYLDQEKPLMASTKLLENRYFALSSTLPAASWPERIAQDLWGALPLGALDTEPALDRGGWSSIAPFSTRSVPSDHLPPDLVFLRALHTERMPFSSSARSIGPGACHVGYLQSFHGLSAEDGLRHLAYGVSSGFVATQLAYSRAIEQALGLTPSDEARDGRMILSEIERIGVHCRDIARLAQHMGFGLLSTHTALAEELVAELCLRHGAGRRLNNTITPAGIMLGLNPQALARDIHDALMPRLPVIAGLHAQMMEALEGLGTISPSQAERHALGGLVGRASGRSFDLRQLEDDMRHVPGRAGSAVSGDAWARQSLRLAEIRDSLRRITRIADQFGYPLPAPEHQPTASGEGIGASEGPHGDIWCWVRLRDSKLDGIHLRNPSLSQLPILPMILHDRSEDISVLLSLGFDPNGAEL